MRAFSAASQRNPDEGATILLIVGTVITKHQKSETLTSAIQKFMAMAHFLKPDVKFTPIRAESLPQHERQAYEKALAIAPRVPNLVSSHPFH